MSQTMFQYLAVDGSGGRTRGKVKASDRADAYRQLTASGLRPVRIKGATGGGQRRRAVTLKDLSHFTYQLAVLMDARIPIVEGLHSIADQEPNQMLREVTQDIAGRITAGSTVTDSFMAHRDMFGDVYIQTIRAAEISGNMVAVLNKLAEMLERRYDMTKTVKGALMYPVCVTGALAVAVTFLLIFVVPKFATMFASRGLDLPLPTLMLVETSEFMRSYWYLLLGGMVAIGLLVRRSWGNADRRRRMDGWLHRVPYLRILLKGLAVSRFSHVFGLCLRSGLSLIDALEISGRASGRPMLEADTQKMQEQVKQGGRLSDVMMQCGYLPGFAKRLFTAGEESAELSRMSDIVARHYDREVTHLSKNVTTVIEPVLIMGLAGIVLIVALAIFLPMWNMAALVG